jgi:hypothetical protein
LLLAYSTRTHPFASTPDQGQTSYLKPYHRLGGWFPREANDPDSVGWSPENTRAL